MKTRASESPAGVGAWSRAVAFFSLFFVLLLPSLGQAQQDPLPFFKGYNITGDYVVAGKSLWRKGVNGKATVDIPITVPTGANIVAAILYVQTAERVQWSGIDHATFQTLRPGTQPLDLGPGNQSLAKALTPNWALAPSPCWSVLVVGGRKLVTYRADVLPYLPKDANGEAVVTGVHRVVVPDAGNLFGDDDEGGIEVGNILGPRAIGASLVVIYSIPSSSYKMIVINDGGFTKRAFSTMIQPIRGFYQASNNPTANMTMIVGDGRPILSEKVLFNGLQVGTNNPFNSADGPKWDNRKFTLTAQHLPGGTLDQPNPPIVRVEPHTLLSDCLTFSAIIFSTTVKDSEDNGKGDGIIDIVESQNSTPLRDPNGQTLPNFWDMGARPTQRDVFVEIGALWVPPQGPSAHYGLEESVPHNHLPLPTVLKMVGDAFDAKGIKCISMWDPIMRRPTDPPPTTMSSPRRTALGRIWPAVGN